MASPLSPVVANLFMEDFESKALASAPFKPNTWKRFVDDTFINQSHGPQKLYGFHMHLKYQSLSIKFTMETEIDGFLPFLDVLISKKNDGSLSHPVF